MVAHIFVRYYFRTPTKEEEKDICYLSRIVSHSHLSPPVVSLISEYSTNILPFSHSAIIHSWALHFGRFVFVYTIEW